MDTGAALRGGPPGPRAYALVVLATERADQDAPCDAAALAALRAALGPEPADDARAGVPVV